MVTPPQSKFTFHLFRTPNSIYTIKCNPVRGMQVAHRGLIKNLTIPWQENRIKNMAASVNQVRGCGNSSESHEGCACFCVCVCWAGGGWCSHACTLDNPHPGQAQTAVFQNTAEGNYELGRPLDHEADSILQCILSPRLSPAKTGLDQVNNDSHHLTVTKHKQASCTKPTGDRRPWQMA